MRHCAPNTPLTCNFLMKSQPAQTDDSVSQNIPERVAHFITELASASSKSDQLRNDQSLTNNSLSKRSQKSTFLPVKAYVMGIGFLAGAFEIIYFSGLDYQRNNLKLSPAKIQLFLTLILLPWCVKPMFGYVIDKLIVRLRSARLLIVISSVMIICVLTPFVYTEPNTPFFYSILFVLSISVMMQNIVCEYLLVLSTKKSNERTGEANANHLPYFFGSRGVGLVLGNFFGGRLMQAVPTSKIVFIIMCFATGQILLSLLYFERPHKHTLGNPALSDQIGVIGRQLTRDRVFSMILISFLVNLTPNLDILYTFYLTDSLNFSGKDLGNLMTIGMVFYVFGLALYTKVFRKTNPKVFYLALLCVLFIVNASFLLIVTGVAQGIGLNQRHLSMAMFGVHQFLVELNTMPIVTIWCAICPQGLEATSIALLTGINNLGVNFAKFHGSFAAWLLGAGKNSSANIWRVTVYQGLYMAVMLVFVFKMTFPDIKTEVQKVEEELRAIQEQPTQEETFAA